MSGHSRGGDSEALGDLLESLQTRRQLLAQKLPKLKDKNNGFEEKLDLKKSRTSSQSDARNRLIEELSQLKDRSLSAKQSVERIDSNISQSTQFVQQFMTQSEDKTANHSVVMNDMTLQMNSLSQVFVGLALTQFGNQSPHDKSEPQNQCKDQSSEEVDQQNKALTAKRDMLMEELNQPLDGSEEVAAYSAPELNKTGSDIKWNDWPIRDRMTALELFSDENQLLIEDMEVLQTNEVINPKLIIAKDVKNLWTKEQNSVEVIKPFDPQL